VPTSQLDRFYARVRNEFLRFNDLRAPTQPAAFWSLLLVFASSLALPLMVFLMLPETAETALRLAYAIYSGASAFLIIPTCALFLRRYSDIEYLANLVSRLSDFQKRNQIRRRLFVIFIWLMFTSTLIVAFWLNSLITWLVLLTLSLVPSSTRPLLQPKNTTMATPPSFSGRPSPRNLPGPQVSTPPNPPSANAAFRASLPTPSKALFSRVGFWLAVVIGLLTMLTWLFPNLTRDFDDRIAPILPTASVAEKTALTETTLDLEILE